MRRRRLDELGNEIERVTVDSLPRDSGLGRGYGRAGPAKWSGKEHPTANDNFPYRDPPTEYDDVSDDDPGIDPEVPKIRRRLGNKTNRDRSASVDTLRVAMGVADRQSFAHSSARIDLASLQHSGLLMREDIFTPSPYGYWHGRTGTKFGWAGKPPADQWEDDDTTDTVTTLRDLADEQLEDEGEVVPTRCKEFR